MNALLTAIVLWLSANCDLPSTFEHPKIERVPQTEMIVRRHRDSADRSGFTSPEVELQAGRQVVAIYDDDHRTIYLAEDWTGGTPAELSVLVHEMVHHLQNTAGLRFECPADREKLAYEAQEKWLGLFGRNLLTEFNIDPLALKVSTTCF